MAALKSEMQVLGNKKFSGFASLYVGDLSPDVTEGDLLHKFSLTVPVVSVHLCRNSVTGKSLCYAYVNFESTFIASIAMSCLNHTDLKGKAIRIMWSQRDLAHRRQTGFGNLFVKNLDSSITSSYLEQLFSPFGVILSCKVVEENGYNKGFGFVQFDTEQSAVAARCALHGFVQFNGKRLFVAKFINKNERAETLGKQELTNVYVKNLMEDVTEDVLQRLFSTYGKVSSVVVMRDGMGRSRGFGFVNFCNQEDAKKAVESLNGRPLGPKNLFVGSAVRKAERMKMLKQQHSDKYDATFKVEKSNLYVKNLSESIDETRLKEIFGSYGEISSAKVMRYEDGKSKGFGFVGFSNIEESKKAKRELNGYSVDGKSLVVRVAERKEDRLKRMEQYFEGHHYLQAPPVPSPALRGPPSYVQPYHTGGSYYYRGSQLPKTFHKTFTYIPAAYHGNLKYKRSEQVVGKESITISKGGAKQKVDSKGQGNQKLEPITISKAKSSSGTEVESNVVTISVA